MNSNGQASNARRAMAPRFHLGQVVATPAALTLMERFGINVSDLLSRHQRGDFGDLCADDQRANEDALTSGARIFSSYVVGPTSAVANDGEACRIWVITEACDDDGRRRSTCLLTPECY